MISMKAITTAARPMAAISMGSKDSMLLLSAISKGFFNQDHLSSVNSAGITGQASRGIPPLTKGPQGPKFFDNTMVYREKVPINDMSLFQTRLVLEQPHIAGWFQSGAAPSLLERSGTDGGNYWHKNC
jgi:hypothetical protein